MPINIRTGLLAGLGAYTIWGLLPLYFKLVGEYSAGAILVHRVVWSVPTGIVLVLMAARWRDLARVVTPRRLFWLTASGLLIGLNWFTYIWAVEQDRVMEASLGYYINPLVNVAVGAVFMAERLRTVQWIAVLLACIGVSVETLALGRLPIVALVLCFCFAAYSVIRKQIAVDSRIGFLVEVLVLLPVLAIWAEISGMWAALVPRQAIDWPLLMVSGPITATPLILFAIAARRLRLSTIGFIQYLGPTLQFAIGLAYGEPLGLTRLTAFGFIWAAVIVFSLDSVRREMAERRARRSIVRQG